MKSFLKVALFACAISTIASDDQNQKNNNTLSTKMSNWKTFAFASGATITTLGLFHPLTAPLIAVGYEITKYSNNLNVQIIPTETNKKN